MGFDGSGNYTRTNGTQTGATLWQDRAAISPATISASEHDAEMNDVANALTACIKADGSKTATNNQPMGGFKHTGVADATLANQYATLGQVQTGLTVNDLVVNANSTTTAFRVTQTGSGEALRVEDSANPDSTPFVIDSSGNVGIGTATPVGKLHVDQPTNPGIADYVPVRFNLNTSGTGVHITNIGSGDCFRVEDSANPDSTPFVIDSSGNVGIGSTSPGAKLVVRGAGNTNTNFNRSTDATDAAIVAQATTTTANSGGQILFSTGFGIVAGVKGALFDGTGPAGHLLFQTSDTTGDVVERARITSKGELLVGGTTDNGAYNVQCNGTGVWGAGAYVNGSDERIKDEITSLDSCLTAVRALNPVTYRYKSDWCKDQSIQPGFIAQEIETTFADKPYREGLVQQGPTYKSLAYQNLIPILTKALQELAAKVETLEAEIATLKGG